MSEQERRTSSEDLAGLDEPVRRLFERIAAPAAAETPDLDAIGAAVADLAADLDYWQAWLERLGGAAGSWRIHAPERGPRLSLVHRPEGQFGTVHDHRTWVTISPIAGREMHRRYRIDGDPATARPQLFEVRALDAADILTMLPPDDVHDHGHLAGEGRPAHVLIMTGDDQTRFTRNEWDLATGRHRLLGPGDAGRWLASEPMPDARRARDTAARARATPGAA